MSGYTTDRFGADMKITVPAGYAVAGAAWIRTRHAGDKGLYEFQMARASFPGSIAVVKGNPVRAPSEGVTTALSRHLI